ncbi:hypothetical protein [Streptomyces litchfieldiae]|uniref:Chromosome partitioning protein n=1 Tax=Streptomyces litchfieldiae TaxID=3075543 RepID=A0ABU2MPJ4_9ACTN|nr:hypothetical protein [Streptomyces sp. DSM 44938]MDT0343535.1 hypothetical protein [Streptomyces sp. DSM 44938]
MIELGAAATSAAMWLFQWAAARVAGRAEAAADQVLDVALERLETTVRGELGEDPALERLTEEAAEGRDTPSDRTRRRVADALEDAAERDPAFAEALRAALREIQEASGTSATATDGIAVGGDLTIKAEGGSIAAGVIHGDVSVNPPPAQG